MHLVCKAHKKRVIFFQASGLGRSIKGALVVYHRNDGSECDLPLMGEWEILPVSAIDRALHLHQGKLFLMDKAEGTLV